MLGKKDNYVGRSFTVEEEFYPCCCKNIFNLGDVLEVVHQLSPNRLMIKTIEGYGHRVKRSALNRCCKEKLYA